MSAGGDGSGDRVPLAVQIDAYQFVVRDHDFIDSHVFQFEYGHQHPLSTAWQLRAGIHDHGAQFFTVRTGEFATVVEDAVRAAAVAEWCRGFSRDGSIGVDGNGTGEIGAGDGHPRYRGGRGMTDLPKWLAARLGEWGDAVEIRTAAKVASIAAANGGVRITIDREGGGSEIVAASGVVLTPPVPQALELMQAGGLLAGGSVDQEAIESLRTVDYDPCFTALLVLDRPSLVPPPGAIQFAAQLPGLPAACLQVDEANIPGNPADGPLAAASMNLVLDAIDKNTERAVHFCFGNYGGQTIQKGNWQKLLTFLNALHTDHLVLELAHRPKADLDALKHIDKKITLGVGVIDIKVNHIETADEVAARIEAVEKKVGPGRVRWVHPDCGFWMLKRSIADRKMEALVRGRDLYLGR